MAQEIDINLNVNTGQAEKQLNNLGTAIKDVDKQATNLDATFQEVYGDLQPLTARMGEAEDRLYELAKAGKQNTTEYKELLKTVGEYKRVQQETDKVVDAAAQTMASKLGGSLNAVAGGFSLAQGTMGLFGTQSKDVEQAVLKVQSAMAISQGFETIREGAKSISALGAVIFGSVAAKTADTAATEANNASQSKNIIGRGIAIVQTGVQTVLTAGLTAATWLFNAAMAANPIGAIVAVIALLIASGYALINMFKESSAAAKKNELANKALANEIKNNKKEQDKANETFQASRDHQLGMAKASGKSAEEIRKLTLQLAKQEVQQNATNYQTNRAIALEARRIASSEDATDAEKKTAEEATKLSNESTKALEQSVKNRRKVESDNAIARKQEETDAYKDSQEKQKKAGDDAVNTAKENAEKLAKEEKDALTKKYRDAEAKADDFYAAEQKAKEGNLKATMSAQAVELQTLRDSYAEKLKYAKENGMSSVELQAELLRKENEIKLKFQNEAIAKEDEQWLRMQQLNLEKSDYDALVRQQKYEKEYIAAEGNAELQLALKKEYLKKEEESEKENADAIKKIDQEKAKAREQWLSAGANTLKQAATLLGESTDAGKAAAVAGATIETYQAAVSSYNSLSGIPFVGPALGAVAAGVAVASGIANVKKILAVKTPNGGGGGGAPTAAPAPSFNIVGPSGTNQIAESIAGKESQPLKAFVVGGDVTSQQSLNRGIVQNATLG